jgi:hypothetical protein
MDEETYQLALNLRDRLRDELMQNETFRAFEHAEAMLAIWDGARAKPGNHIVQTQTVRTPRAPDKHSPGSRTSVITNAAAEYLRQKGSRATSGEILKELTDRGIQVGGKDPSKVTSSYLSHSPLFNNIPGQGYGLAEWPQTTETTQRSTTAKVPTKAQRMLDAIREFITPRGIVHRKDILNHLTSLGLMQGIKNPMLNLAAFISDHKDVLASHGEGRWSLATSDTPESETPNSSELFGAPKGNGALPLNL